MLQQRMPDPTNNNTGGIWVNPLMSVAHNYPILVRKALMIASQRAESITDKLESESAITSLCDYASAIAKYVKIAASDPAAETYLDAVAKSGLDKVTEKGKQLFVSAFAMVMEQVYLQAIREALHPGNTPIGVAELMKFVDERSDAKRS